MQACPARRRAQALPVASLCNRTTNRLRSPPITQTVMATARTYLPPTRTPTRTRQWRRHRNRVGAANLNLRLSVGHCRGTDRLGFRVFASSPGSTGPPGRRRLLPPRPGPGPACLRVRRLGAEAHSSLCNSKPEMWSILEALKVIRENLKGSERIKPFFSF